MSEPLHDIDKIFFDNIEGRSEYPSKKVWEKIDAGLDKTSVVIYKKKYEKIKRAALLLLLLISGLLLYEIVTIRHFKNDYTGNNKIGDTNKNIGNENANSQPLHEGAGNSTKQIENSSISPRKETTPIPGGQDSEVTMQKGNVDINTMPKQNNRGLTFEENTQVRKQDEKSYISFLNGKKTNQHTFQQGLPGIRDAKFTGLEKAKRGLKNKDAGNNQNLNPKAGNSSEISNDNVVSKSQRAPKQNLISSPGLPEEKDKSARSPDENILLISVLARVTGGILVPVTMLHVNAKIDLPEKVLTKSPEQQGPKPSGKIDRNSAGKQGLSLTFLFSPSVVWRSLENDIPHRSGVGGNRVDDNDAIRHSEHNNLSYTEAVRLNMDITRKISVQSGLNYTSTSSKVNPKLIFADRDNNGNVRYRLDCSSGYSFLLPKNLQSPSPGDSLMVNDTRNSLSYLGIPLTIAYKLSSGKLSLSASAGGQANVLLKGKTTSVFGKGTSAETTASGNTEGLKSTYFSAITGISAEYRLNKKMAVVVVPSSQFALSSINKGASVKTRSNYFSVGVGLKIKL